METKFYTLIIKTYNNGTADKTSLYPFDNLDSAIAMAHTQWGQNIGASTIARVMAKVTNSFGAEYPFHTLYWEAPVTVTITFNGNGETSGTMDAQTFTVGTAQALSANQFEKNGATFEGWARNSNATSAEFIDGASVQFEEDTTLYAVWS